MYLSFGTAVEGRLKRPARDAAGSKTNLLQRSLGEARTLQNSTILGVPEDSGFRLILNPDDYPMFR